MNKEKLEWQPIETAPKNNKRFLAKIGNAVYIAFFDIKGRFIWIMHGNDDGKSQKYLYKKGFKDQPTHWLSLPSLPKMKLIKKKKLIII